MERATALKRIQKLLGKDAYWRIGTSITSPERRMATQIARLEADFQAAVAKREMQEHGEELLRNDPTYQSLKAIWQKKRDVAKKAESNYDGAGYRFEVGTRNLGGMFTSTTPKAYGDTWEEIFEKLGAQSALQSEKGTR